MNLHTVVRTHVDVPVGLHHEAIVVEGHAIRVQADDGRGIRR
ncbi:MAG: hypothetical protein ACREMP_04070 [Candidatus Tyrphobacter sp.]